MAASLKKIDLKYFTKIYGLPGRLSYSRLRKYSTTKKQTDSAKLEKEADKSSTDDRVPQVGMSADGQVLVCWHPEPTHPYEHTKPLPNTAERLSAKEDSVLKVQLLKREERKYRPDGPTIAELSNLFFTTKHRWYPLGQRSKALRKERIEEEDRESI